VSHDPSITRVADRILRMHDGVVQADVAPTTDETSPADYGEMLRSRITELDATLAGLDSQFKAGTITGDEYVERQTRLKNTMEVLREELHRLGIVH